eukprot:651433-Pleurochrysis_carterae.AAC.1
MVEQLRSSGSADAPHPLWSALAVFSFEWIKAGSTPHMGYSEAYPLLTESANENARRAQQKLTAVRLNNLMHDMWRPRRGATASQYTCETGNDHSYARRDGRRNYNFLLRAC